MSSIATEIIDVFLGDKWLLAALPLKIIALGVPLRMVRNLMMPALLGLGRSDVNLSIEVVAVVVMTLSLLRRHLLGAGGGEPGLGGHISSGIRPQSGSHGQSRWSGIWG